jgi:uncharacterized protein YodC (DUF2158 family)
MADTFKVGDVVKHKAKNLLERNLHMTIQSFINPVTGFEVQEMESDWVLCQWFNSQAFGYQQTRFNINELQKVS